jgi:hypothetical protein
MWVKHFFVLYTRRKVFAENDTGLTSNFIPFLDREVLFIPLNL